MLRCEHSLDGLGVLAHPTGRHNPGRNLPWVAATRAFLSRLRFSRRPQRARNLHFLFLCRPFALAGFPAWIGSLCTCPDDGKIFKALTALHRCGEPPRLETPASPSLSRVLRVAVLRCD